MKTFIKIMIVLPLLTLGGCYTQLSLSQYERYRDEEDEYYDEDAEYAYEDSTEYSEDEYYDEYDRYDNYRPSLRRYYFGYYPGLSYNSYDYSYGWNRWYLGVSYPWYYDNWYSWSPYSGYNPYYYGYGYGYGYSNPYYWNYPYYVPGYNAPLYKYRQNEYTRLRDNSGDRGTTIRDRSGRGGSGSSRPNASISGRERTRTDDVDLGRVGVSRSKDNSGTKVNKGTEGTERKRVRETRPEQKPEYRTPSSRTREDNQGRGSSTSRGSGDSGSRERSQPSYEPRSNPSPSYSPPASSSSSSSGRSSSGSSGSSSSGRSSSGSSGGSRDSGGRGR